MSPIRLSLIGAGFIAHQHLKVLQGIPWMRVVGITSRTKAKAEALAKSFKIPVCADTLDALVDETKPDALLILVSVNQIYSVVLRAFQYKLPLFIEKPAGMTPEENKKLAEAAKKIGVRTMVGFNRRYYSIFHKGIDIIKQHGALLGVYIDGHERMWRIREGNKFKKEELDHWIFANSVHTTDLLRFFGGEPHALRTIAHRRFGESRGDQFAAIMEFDSNAIGQYSAHWYSPGGWCVVLYGNGVTVEFKPLERGSWMGKDFVAHEIEPDGIDIKYKPGFYRQMEAFGHLVRDGIQEWPALDLAGAYKTMRLTEKMSLH